MYIVITSILLIYIIYFTYSAILYFKDEHTECKNKIEYIRIPEIIHDELKMRYNK